MKIVPKDGYYDPERDFFLDQFEVRLLEEYKAALEIGVDPQSNLFNIMADYGYDNVDTVDLKPLNRLDGNGKHFTGDFCDYKVFQQIVNYNCLPEYGYYDLIYSVSALEHFGLDTYGDGYNPQKDWLAVRMISWLLQEDGYFCLTVPFGGKCVVLPGHWKVYDEEEFARVFLQDIFEFAEDPVIQVVEEHKVFMEETQETITVKSGTKISKDYLRLITGGQPYVSIYAKLKKIKK